MRSASNCTCGNWRANCSLRHQCVVARLPSSSPVAASSRLPEHTLVTRAPRAAQRCTKRRVRASAIAVSTPSPPATSSVSTSLARGSATAAQATPDELRTSPGCAATTLSA